MRDIPFISYYFPLLKFKMNKNSRGSRLSRYDQTKPTRVHQKSKTSLKNRIRSIERLIRSNKVKGDALANQKKILNNLKLTLSTIPQNNINKKEKRLAIRYHKVKFLERVKLVRKLKKAKQNEDSEKFENLAKDLKYVLFFPKAERYISIIKEANSEDLIKIEKFRKIAIENSEKESFDINDFLSKQDKNNTKDLSNTSSNDINNEIKAENKIKTLKNSENQDEEDDFFV